MDLSRIPEPARSQLKAKLEQLPADVRSKLESQLAKLPHDKIEQVLASPMLARLMEKANRTATKAHAPGTGMTGRMHAPHHTSDPNNFYNQTIRRGDRPMPSLLVFILAAALVISLLSSWGLLEWGPR